MIFGGVGIEAALPGVAVGVDELQALAHLLQPDAAAALVVGALGIVAVGDGAGDGTVLL